MSRVVRVILAVFSAAILAVSCAKQPTEDIDAKRQLAFEAWMDYYGEGAVKYPSGIYIKKIHSENEGVIKPPQEGNWVRINYTSRVLTNGNIFLTRDSAVARLQGTFQYYTHYVPQYVKFEMGDDSELLPGVYAALQTMNAGDSVRVYMPSDMAYGGQSSSFGSGYQGQVSSISPNTPIIMDLKLNEIVPTPVVQEIESVQQYAYDRWGLTISDTIKTNIYRRSLSVSKDTATVKIDSSVSVYYVGRFMDGFVFDTNYADTARRYNIYTTTNARKYDSITVRLGTTDTMYVKGFYQAILGMRYGAVSQTIFPSTYGYGTKRRNTEGATWIQPYSPLIYTIQVIPTNGDGTAYHPYSIKGVKALKHSEDGVWITGYVVGAVEGNSIATDAIYSDTVKVKTNLLLADTRTASDAAKVIAIELPEGPLRDQLNLPDNGTKIYRKKIAFYGNIQPYLGQVGMVDPTQYVKSK